MLTPNMTRKQFESVLAILYKGTNASREKIRFALKAASDKFFLAQPLTPDELETYVDRIRWHQEAHRLYGKMAPEIFDSLPSFGISSRGQGDLMREFIEQDRKNDI